MAKQDFGPAHILLPEGVDLAKWAVLACDQFTSQPEYWQAVEETVGTAPSTLYIILPEVYLEAEGVQERIACVHKNMEKYLENTLKNTIQGMVYIERTMQNGKIRQGLVGCVDLEAYSYQPGASCNVRPSEGTVVDRIPPRLAVRRGAALESPHILMLVDDETESVIEPLAAQKESLPPLYDVDLMQNGGRLRGWAVTDTGLLAGVEKALEALADRARFAKRYDTQNRPFQFAVGDGNHSLATAKAWWEEVKESVPEAERENHPARYCLVELENIQSDAIEIEPIHRVLFGVEAKATLAAWEAYCEEQGLQCVKGAEENGQKIEWKIPGGKTEVYSVKNPQKPLAVGTLEAFLEELAKQQPGLRVDFVHGEDAVASLVEGGAVGVILPPLAKSDLFRGVAQGGVLPKKTFSMGHAVEKRYYLECRKLEK